MTYFLILIVLSYLKELCLKYIMSLSTAVYSVKENGILSKHMSGLKLPTIHDETTRVLFYNEETLYTEALYD